MTIDTSRLTLARQMAGPAIPSNTDILGLVIESDDCYCRNWSALVHNTVTNVYGTMICGVWRSIDPRIAMAASMAAKGASK